MEHGLWWEDFLPGSRWETASRAVHVGDLDVFSEVSGDRNLLHLDDEYARSRGFDGRIAHGVLGLAVATGLINRLGLTRGTLVALLGTNWNYVRPLYPDTGVRALLTVGAVTPSRREDRGRVVLEVELVDDAGAVLQRGVLTLLVHRRPTGGARPG
jgi:3-hydroxybutyryl-CoA dehydratase